MKKEFEIKLPYVKLKLTWHRSLFSFLKRIYLSHWRRVYLLHPVMKHIARREIAEWSKRGEIMPKNYVKNLRQYEIKFNKGKFKFYRRKND